VVIDHGTLYVSLGNRTDWRGAGFLDRHFGAEYNVVQLHFRPHYTQFDTILGVIGPGQALIYEPAFEPASLALLKATFPQLISLSKEEQKNSGANVLSLGPGRLLSIAENPALNSGRRPGSN
jgi:N-dimethylarginine dimethylaminohydrolase